MNFLQLYPILMNSTRKVFFVMYRRRRALSTNHFYLVVFNLKNPSFLIIDNVKHNGSIKEAYGIELELLHSLFCNYLHKVCHVKVREMLQLQCKEERVEPDWVTKGNFVDSGVFVMRHMETFVGAKLKEWKCGFEKENTRNKAQEKQIIDLRKKYAAKILLSDLNIMKSKVAEEVKEWQSFDAKEQNWYLEKPRKELEDRFS